MTTKLTLTMEDSVIDSAEQYARGNGKSLSDIVENYLRLIVNEDRSAEQLSPQVTELMGTVKLPKDFNYKKDLGKAMQKKHSITY